MVMAGGKVQFEVAVCSITVLAEAGLLEFFATSCGWSVDHLQASAAWVSDMCLPITEVFLPSPNDKAVNSTLHRHHAWS
jgi:hypothetical protein